MQEELRQNNNILLIGKIVSECVFSHEIYGEDFYTIYLDVSRLSEVFDTLPITISERLIDKSKLKIGETIEVIGQIRSYNSILENKNHLILTVFAKEINYDLISSQNKNPNQLTLNGFICKPPIYRKTPFGREICDILLAVNRSYNKSDYIPCIIWGRNAKFVGNLEVSNNIKVSGRMQSRKYNKKILDNNLNNNLDNSKTKYLYEQYKEYQEYQECSENQEQVIEKIAYEISVSKIELIKPKSSVIFHT